MPVGGGRCDHEAPWLKPPLPLRANCCFSSGVGRDVFGENFNSHRAVQAGVGGLVDFAHAADTDGGLNSIRPETNAGTEGRACLERMGL